MGSSLETGFPRCQRQSSFPMTSPGRWGPPLSPSFLECDAQHWGSRTISGPSSHPLNRFQDSGSGWGMLPQLKYEGQPIQLNTSTTGQSS